MYGNKHVHVVGIHFLANLGEVAVVNLGVGCSLHVGIRAILHARVHDVLFLHSHCLELVAKLEHFPQVGVALIEAACVGHSVIKVGIWYCCHRAVVGAPASVSRIEIYANLINCLRIHCAGCK